MPDILHHQGWGDAGDADSALGTAPHGAGSTLGSELLLIPCFLHEQETDPEPGNDAESELLVGKEWDPSQLICLGRSCGELLSTWWLGTQLGQELLPSGISGSGNATAATHTIPMPHAGCSQSKQDKSSC